MSEKKISNIVFTKNRPLQLASYLFGLQKYLPKEIIQTYIFYKKDLFDNEYQQLFRNHPDCIVVNENNFHDDFVKLINSLSTDYILFGTDDVVFFAPADFNLIDNTFKKYSDDIIGFSFRLSLEYVKSGKDKIEDIGIGDKSVFKANWKISDYVHVRYPFELDATIYKTAIVKKIVNVTAKEYPKLKKFFDPDSLKVKILKKFISMKNFLISLDTFHNPNTLETHCYRWCKHHKRKVPSFLFFKNNCATALQINTVNPALDDRFVKSKQGNSVAELNEMYKQGYLVDIDYVASQKPTLAIYDEQLFRLKKYQVN